MKPFATKTFHPHDPEKRRVWKVYKCTNEKCDRREGIPVN
jgi:hypothetical protein